MDRRVKERLVGATILVAVVVLGVPELLSGRRSDSAPTAPSGAPTSEPMRTVTVDVTQNPATEPAQPEPAASDVEVHAASPSAAQPRPPAPKAVPQPSPKLESPQRPPISVIPRVAPQSRATEPRRGAWAVQLGSFVSESNADKLSRALKAQGYAVYVSSSGAGRGLRHRVRIGPYADREMAQRAIAKLKAQRHPASLVPPTAPK